ncbi:MAG: hypothetical protein WCI04_01505 [archaeon]
MKMQLPLLEFVDSLFFNKDLTGSIVIACQHIMEPQMIFFRKLVNCGVKNENFFVLGKCYSTNKNIFNELKMDGFKVHEDSAKFDSYVPFDKQWSASVAKFVSFVEKSTNIKNFSRIIVIDDGGFLIEEIQKRGFDIGKIVAVEQTSSGYAKLRDSDFKFPIINVARSNAKLLHESPYVAELFIKNLNIFLTEIKKAPKSTLIIGNGAVGGAISNALSKLMQVKHIDIEKEKSDFELNNLHNVISNFDLIVGATGKEILGLKDLKFIKKGSILASVSSSDREFSAAEIRREFQKTNNPHHHFVSNGIVLLNAGFPVTFKGARCEIPLEKIQLTMALLYAGILQGIKNINKVGIVELNKNIQKKIVFELYNLKKV